MLDNEFTIALSGLLILYFALNLMVGWRLRASHLRRKSAWTALQTLLLLYAAIGVFLQSNRLAWYLGVPYGLREVLRQSAAVYLICAVSGFLLAECTTRLARHRTSPGRRRALAAIAGAAPAVVAGYGTFIERRRLRIEHVRAASKRLPRDLSGIRIVQLSDIHLSPLMPEAELRYAVDAANELNAHVIVVTGDFITSALDPLEPCLRQLARLRAQAGVFATIGNHEYYARVDDQISNLAPAFGIEFLRYSARPLFFGDHCLNLAGVDYESTRPVYLNGCERLIVPGAFNVLLSHNPNVFPTAARQGFDLTLAGHTHGGQVNVEILDTWIRRYVTPYIYGSYTEDERMCYVTRGIGTIQIPVRVNAPPEIALIELARA